MADRAVLALDLATKTGWAAGPDPVRYGVWDLSAYASVARRLRMLRTKLDRLRDEVAITDVMYETPWVGRKTHQHTARLLMAMPVIVEMFCDEHDIRCWEVAAPTWRKHFLGVGQVRVGKHGSSRDELKRMARERCRLLGYAVSTDDEADALGILDYALGFLKVGDIGLPVLSQTPA